MVIEREDKLALIDVLFIKKLVAVRVSSLLPTGIWSSWSFHLPEFWRSILPFETSLRSSDSSNSHRVFDVHLGLHPYLQDGGRSRLEIQVEFHEGVIPLSTLLAFYWYDFSGFISSVLCPLSFLSSFFLGQTGANLTETTCWKLTYASGGSSNRPTQRRRNSFCVQYLWSLGSLHQRASSTLHSLFGWYWLASTSDSHVANMGHVESEQAVIYYSSDLLQH